jgi:hypothetical protein
MIYKVLPLPRLQPWAQTQPLLCQSHTEPGRPAGSQSPRHHQPLPPDPVGARLCLQPGAGGVVGQEAGALAGPIGGDLEVGHLRNPEVVHVDSLFRKST